MEQQMHWFYRWRLVGNLPAPYLRWREAKTASPLVVIQSEQAFGQIEVQWRRYKRNGWRQTALHVLKPHKVELEISASERVELVGETHSVIATVRDQPARFFFRGEDPFVMEAGAVRRVTGYADGPFPANILLKPGEFRCKDGAISVRNIGCAADFLAPVEGDAVLSRVEGMEKRRIYSVTRKQS